MVALQAWVLLLVTSLPVLLLNLSRALNRRGKKFPLNIEKQLLAAIEGAGGLHSFPFGESEALDKLLNETEHRDDNGENLFGARGDKVRRAYQKQLFYIRNRWTRGQCYKHLSWLTLQPFDKLKKAAKQGDPVPDCVPSAVLSASKSSRHVLSSVNVGQSALSKRKAQAPAESATKQPSSACRVIDTSPVTPTSNVKMSGKFVLPPKCTGAVHIAGDCSHSLFCPTRQHYSD